MPQPREEDQFAEEFQSLPQIEEQEETPSMEEQDENPALAPSSVKDRRHRRLERQLDESRKFTTELVEFIKKQKAPSETQSFQRENALDADVHSMLFGDQAETPETRAAAMRVQRVLERQAGTAEERAYNRALEAFQQTQSQGTTEIEENRNYIEEELENIEDRFNVDLSGDTEQSRRVRNGFIDYVERLSRKDRDGEIIDYPDMQYAWEEFNSRRERASTTTRNRQVASRSMSPSAGGDAPSDAAKAATEKYMLENGFI